MTLLPSPLTCTWSTENGRSGRLSLVGELDYASVDGFLSAVNPLIDEHPALLDLHLDCGGLSFCDSMGLSALLTVRRRTAAVGMRLHLDNRNQVLERMLSITGTLDHLTRDPHGGGVSE